MDVYQLMKDHGFHPTSQSQIEALESILTATIKDITAMLRNIDWAYDLGEDARPNDIALMAAHDIEQHYGLSNGKA